MFNNIDRAAAAPAPAATAHDCQPIYYRFKQNDFNTFILMFI